MSAEPIGKERIAAEMGRMIRAYGEMTGCDPAPDADGPQTVCGDLVADILHWVERNDPGGRLAALETARRALGHYASESSIDRSAAEVDELGPEAEVTVEIRCDGKLWRSATRETPEIEDEHGCEPAMEAGP